MMYCPICYNDHLESKADKPPPPCPSKHFTKEWQEKQRAMDARAIGVVR